MPHKATPFNDRNETLAQLMQTLLPYIRKRAASGIGCGLDLDDLVQEGLVGLFSAFKTYDQSKGASFNTYACTCIDNALSAAVRSAGRKKHLPLNTFLPIEDTDAELSGLQPSPEEQAISDENFCALRQKINTRLSQREQDVLRLRMAGLSYRQIAERLGCTEKAVDNRLQSVRKKLK